jgi:hypothetical protein
MPASSIGLFLIASSALGSVIWVDRLKVLFSEQHQSADLWQWRQE